MNPLAFLLMPVIVFNIYQEHQCNSLLREFELGHGRLIFYPFSPLIRNLSIWMNACLLAAVVISHTVLTHPGFLLLALCANVMMSFSGHKMTQLLKHNLTIHKRNVV